MDYLQDLEIRMTALQRKVRLLQDLRLYVETAGSEELAGFGDELRAVTTSSGQSLWSLIAALPGPGGERPPSPNAAAASAHDEAEKPPPGPAPADVAGDDARAEALALIQPAMRAIPAGSFVMGSEGGDGSENPPHRVVVSAFAICDHLVTNREYALFLKANPRWSKDRAELGLRDEQYLSDWSGEAYPEGKEEHPVAFVSFPAANALAEWLGKRLPTEAEWEYAARGGLVGKKFPNGDQMNDKLANLAKQYKGTTPVRKFELNGYGLADMAGNLFEWTADWYGPYPTGEAVDSRGPSEGEYRVVRGGSWMSGASALRVSARVEMEIAACGQVGVRLAG
jgi:formylglycine-generating enzyme required for sulfatase activity